YKSLISEFLERFDILSNITGAAEIITLKMKLDKSYKKIKDSMNALKKIINGGSDLEYYVNLAGLDSKFADAVKLFNEYRFEISDIDRQIADLIEDIKSEPSEKIGIKNLLEEQAGILREKASEVYTSFIEGLVQGLKNANKEAIEHIRDIVLENETIHLLSETIKNKIEGIDKCPEYLKEILFTCSDLVNDIEEAFVEQVFEEIRIELDRNVTMLSELENRFLTTIEEGSSEGAEEVILKYNSGITFNYEEQLTAGKSEDRRGFFEEMGKRVLEKNMSRDIRIGEYIVLPSDGIEVDSSKFEATSLGNETKSGEDELNNLADSILDIGTSFLRTLALNEYIIQHFSNENSDNEGGISGSFFENEAEYILWGSDSQNSNNFFTKSAIMSTRFALDTVHVYSDSVKVAKADALAAATAGWWTFGAGIPVMSNLIKISWAIAEAGIDTKKLWEGEPLAVIKTKGDWITDIGLGNKELASPDFLKMDYEDYLRFFYIAEPMNKKLIRMLDIISLNSPGNFNIMEAFTEVTVNATVSFRSLTGGRHEVEITITESY
ncbi:MAG: hypothetical protein J7L77_03610, partial [Clostridiales bacterium]|nr:hypothetical protein [Clostridiales bacterium]